jgi:hypothetical protein
LGASGWRTPDHRTTGVRRGGEGEERILKSGYLWKKGERRKVCISSPVNNLSWH